MEGVVITKFRQDPDGVYRARVNGVDVDKKYGSWQVVRRAAPHSREYVRTEVMPAVAAALQARVPRDERRRAADRPKPKQQEVAA